MLFFNTFWIEMKFWNFNFWSILIINLFYIVRFFFYFFRIGVVYDGLLNYCVHILKPLIFYAYVLDGLIHFQKGAVFVLRLKIGGYFSWPNIRTNNRIVLKCSHHLFWYNQTWLVQDIVQLLLNLLLNIASRVLYLTVKLLQLLLQHTHFIYQLAWMIFTGHLFALQLLLMHMIYRVRSFFQNFIIQITH